MRRQLPALVRPGPTRADGEDLESHAALSASSAPTRPRAARAGAAPPLLASEGLPLERIRRDRILQEALATGADPLHLSLVFNIDHTNAMAYANAARSRLSSPAEQALSHRPQ